MQCNTSNVTYGGLHVIYHALEDGVIMSTNILEWEKGGNNLVELSKWMVLMMILFIWFNDRIDSIRIPLISWIKSAQLGISLSHTKKFCVSQGVVVQFNCFGFHNITHGDLLPTPFGLPHWSSQLVYVAGLLYPNQYTFKSLPSRVNAIQKSSGKPIQSGTRSNLAKSPMFRIYPESTHRFRWFVSSLNLIHLPKEYLRGAYYFEYSDGMLCTSSPTSEIEKLLNQVS